MSYSKLNTSNTDSEKKEEVKKQSRREPVAIIGMSGFFPESSSVSDFWEKLRNQENFVKTIPDDHDPDESVRLKKGAFLEELRSFDARLFHIPGKEARYMTPQQRLFLMAVWHLFEDACILPASLENKRVAVIVGTEINPYMEYLTTASISTYTCLGMAPTYLPNRISNYFNFKGPSYCIDTSCSSGLTALHQGKKLLRNNEADYVVVAGVSLIYGNKWTRSFFSGSESMGLMTTNGHETRPFQNEASGFTPSEGVISFLLKRGDEAREDQDNIHAFVLGSESTHVGGVGNIAFPDAKEQSKAVIGAYREANVPAETITHIEAHGASSILADSQEIRAFKIAHKHLIKSDDARNLAPCKISTPKPNIGHMHAASGLASVVRLIYSFKERKKLGIKNFKALSSEIKLDKTRFYISEETEEWVRLKDTNGREIPRRGSVHNSGGGGNNVHVVMEEYYPDHITDSAKENKDEVYFLALSCTEESQFLPYAQRIHTHLEKHPDCREELVEYHYLNSRKSLSHRLVFRYKSIENLKEKLERYIISDGKSGYYVNGNHKNGPNLNEIFHKNGKVVQFLNQLNNTRDKSFLFDLWAKGYEAPIKKYYQPYNAYKISLPGYPFKQKEYWLDIYGTEPVDAEKRVEFNKTFKKINGTETHAETESLANPEQSIVTEHKTAKQMVPEKETQKADVTAITERKLLEMVAEVLELDIKDLSAEEELGDYGFNSLGLTELANSINDHYKLHLVPTIFYNYPTVKQLTAFLTDEYDEAIRKKETLPQKPEENPNVEPIRVELPKKKICTGCKSKKCASKKSINQPGFPVVKNEPIAIVGMSARLPGSTDLDDFWEHIRNNKDLITEIPADRWDWHECFGDPKTHNNKTKAKWGGFIDDIDKFDPLHFNISPKEAELMDPQHRIALEEAYHALEDAGISVKSLSGTNTGVFIGSYFDDYATLVDRSRLTDSQIITGLSQSMLTNRISYLLDLRGPSETIDTACSSSLIAIHRGVESIRNGHCDTVIAGGVSLILIPDLLFPLSQAGFLSEDGRCKTFDQNANGYVRSEGVGMIVMKPLSKALADGDRIHALIKSTSENHGGKANTLTSPNPNAQKELLLKAYRSAQVDLRAVGYIEAHGTGTPLGDPIETEGLKLAFNELFKESNTSRPTFPHIKLGSVKSNIGHLEPAAGIAGVLKVILCLKHKTIPGNPQLKNPNEYLQLDGSPFTLQKETASWNTIVDLPRVAGISSFGAGGSNAHVVLEEYEPKPKKAAPENETFIIPLSAKNKIRLKQVVKNLIGFIERNEDVALRNLSYTLQVGRESMNERLVIIADTLSEFKNTLENYENGLMESVFTGNTRKEKVSEWSVETLKDTSLETLTRNRALSSLARLWTEGKEIPWELLYSKEERPDKISLPGYPFARDRYWIPEDKLRQIKIKPAEHTGTTGKTIKLYRSGWKVTELTKGTLPTGMILILNSTEKEQWANVLKDRLENTIIAHPAMRHEIPFNRVEAVIDLGAASKTDYSWTGVIQQVIDTSEFEKIRMIHVKKSGDTLIGQALYQSLAAEYGKVSGLCLELEEASPLEKDIDLILEVLSSEVEQLRIRKITEHWEALVPETIDFSEQLVNITGPVLITGGTRGLGMACARYLVVERKVQKLILLGREKLPEGKEWDAYKTKQGTLGEKIRNINFLQEHGAEVKLLHTPLTDRKKLSEDLAEISLQWGAIKGVIHCAGIVDTETPAFIKKTVEGITSLQEPKVHGLHNLYEALKTHKPDFGILFSSVSAFSPRLGAGQCDYAMANGYLDSFAEVHYREGYRSVQWPSWKETGMGEVTQGIYVEMGLRSLTNKEGTALLGKVLSFPKQKEWAVITPLVYDKHVFDENELFRIPSRKQKSPEVEIIASGSSEVSRWVSAQISEALRLPASVIELDVPFQEYGVDSILLADLVKQFEKALGGISLSPSIILEYPTVGMLSDYFMENYASSISAVLPGEESSTIQATMPPKDLNGHRGAEDEMKQEPSKQESVKISENIINEPIAVIGMGCHFPDADNVGTFWENLKKGRDSIKEVPSSRWDANKLFDPDKIPGKSYSKWGAFIDNIEDFDPGYFGISEELASQIDPLERQWLEVSAEAMADAGYDKKSLSGKAIGVYAGARVGTFRQKLSKLHKDFIVGTGQNFITAHLAHIYNLKGPNMVVDTACSSSLTAIDLAVNSLRRGETEMAFAGGVDILLDEAHFVGLSTAEVLSKDGRTKTFDESADGTGLGEGCGVLLLKRLRDAIDDGDKIYGVIEGTAVNNDGATMGITTPNPKAQQALIETAIRNGQIDRATISYIEAHGTGTLIGDPIELKGITAVLSKSDTREHRCAVGSVKTNIGHLMSAAGVAGVIKTLLAVSAGQLPPTLNCHRPNPRFDFSNAPVYPVRELQEWKGIQGIRRAGISAFGLGGNNAHIILSNAGIPANQKVSEPFNTTNIEFNRKRFWPEELAATPESMTLIPEMDAYFSMKQKKSGSDWIVELDVFNENYILRDHKVHGVSIIPGVTYLELILRSGKELFGKLFNLSRIVFTEPLATGERQHRRVEVRFREGRQSQYEAMVRSRRMDQNGMVYGNWCRHVHCRLNPSYESVREPMNLQAFIDSCKNQLSMDEVYSSARSVEIVHGPFMQTKGTVYQKGGEELMKLHLSDLAESYRNKFFLHPAFLDGATFSGSSFHAIDKNQVSYIPFSIEQFSAFNPLPPVIYVYSNHDTEKYNTPSEVIKSNINVYDEAGNLLVAFKNLAIKKIRHSGLITSLLAETGVSNRTEQLGSSKNQSLKQLTL